MIELLLAAVALAAIAATPVTIWLLARRDAQAFEALMLNNQRSVDAIAAHLAGAQGAGEPARLSEKRIALADKELSAKIELARSAQQFDPFT